jgi:exopolysaccharide production protein ExoZ
MRRLRVPFCKELALADARDYVPEGRTKLSTIWSLHYLRAVAALGVVVFHALGNTGWDFHLGSAGIHLFFTLSGFMMWSIAGQSTTRPLPFLAGRARRIVPMYWIATGVAVCSTWVVPRFYQASRSVPVILKSLFFIPQVGVDGGIFPVLYQGWTLQYEMFFYLLFALCLLAPVRHRLRLLSANFVVLALVGMFLEPKSPALQTYTDPMCLEFLAGVLVAHFGWRVTSPRRALHLAIWGAISFCLSDRFDDALGFASPLILAVTASALIVGLLSLEYQGKMPRRPVLLLLGEASFAIYLFQALGFALVAAFVKGAHPLIRALVYALGATATGVLIHQLIEKPLTALLKEGSRGQRNLLGWMRPMPAVVEI